MDREQTKSDWFDGIESEQAQAHDGLDLLGLLFRRKLWIVFGTVVGLALGFLKFARTKPTFQSTSQMLVQAKMAPLPVERVDSHLRYATALTDDHAFVIQSPLIIAAANSKKLDQLPPLANRGSAVNVISRGLEVEPLQQGSGVLDLRFRGPDPDDCAAVLNAIMKTYSEFLGENQKNIGADMVRMISEAREGLRIELDAKERKYEEFQREAPLFWREGQATNIHQERQAQIESSRSSALLNNSQLEAKISAIDAAIARGARREVLLLIAGQTDESVTSSTTSEGGVLSMRLQDELLSQKYGPKHPKRKSLKRQIDFIREFQENSGGASVADVNESPSVDAPRDKISTYLESLREQLKTGQREVEQLTTLFDAEQQKAKELAAYEAKDASLLDDIERTQSLFDAVVQRLQEINLLEDYGGDRYNVQILRQASRGGKVAPDLARILLAGAALGFFGGFGLGYVLDRTDKTFRDPKDVSLSLQLPLVGHIPEIEVGDGQLAGSTLAASLCAAHRPKSPEAETYRAIRTALYFSTRGQNHRVIQVTSPMPGDGKSTMAANLAITMAQSNKKVLILDGDFRRPVQHTLFGLTMETGMASVVDSKVEPLEAIQSTVIENLFVMACGPRPNNPSELLTSSQFGDLLNLLRDQFDFVLVDTPPLLAVTDASVVAARVDGVLFVLRLRKDNRTQAVRARDILWDMNAKVVGVVVNGVGGKKGSYGYYQGSKYGYGYGGYGYEGSAQERTIKNYYDEAVTLEKNGNGVTAASSKATSADSSPR